MSDAVDINGETMNRLYRCGICSLTSTDIGALREHLVYAHLNSQADISTPVEINENGLQSSETLQYAFVDEAQPEIENNVIENETRDVSGFEDPTVDVDLNFKVKMPSSEMSMFPKHIRPALLFNCSYCDFKHQSFKQVSFHVIENHPKKLDHKLRTLKRTAQDVAVINNSAYLSKNGLKRQRTFLFESSAKPKKAESKRSFSCALCNTKCDKEVILNIHKRCHVEGSDKLICCFCGKQAPTAKAWYGLFIHMVNKHPAEVPAPLSCSVCKKGFVKEFDLQKHMICHSSARPFSCDLCDYSFKYKRNLHDHKVLKHKMGTAQERLALITKLKTRNRPELDVNKPWLQCAHCDYKTKFPAKINVHAKIHAGIKDMACQYCDYRTGDRSCLKRHEWRHRADKPFSCTYCGFTCIQRPQILSHYKNKHSLLPRDASKLVQHINGSRSYVAEEDLVDCVSDITREVEISSENHTISIPDVSDNPVDLDLLTEAAEGLLAASQIELHTTDPG